MIDREVLIVGQGLAGTMLAFACLERGISFHIVDDGHVHAASMVGIASINPVTGRRYAKSWRIDTLIPIAVKAYTQAEKFLGKQYLHPAEMVQFLPDSRIEEIWMLRAADPEFVPYLALPVIEFTHAGIRTSRAGNICNGYHLLVNTFLNDASRFLIRNEWMTEMRFDPASIDIAGKGIRWGGYIFQHVVFCEGYAVAENPYFDWLEIYPMKGECLILHIPGLHLCTHVKAQVSLIPLPQEDLYWCGSTYDRYEADPAPTAAGKNALVTQVARFLTADFSIADHVAGIRATTRDRRPYVGTHPAYPAVHVIAGMGTKGASLAPYCAGVLADTLCEGNTIPNEISILRHGHR